jgi:hypothetical protein
MSIPVFVETSLYNLAYRCIIYHVSFFYYINYFILYFFIDSSNSAYNVYIIYACRIPPMYNTFLHSIFRLDLPKYFCILVIIIPWFYDSVCRRIRRFLRQSDDLLLRIMEDRWRRYRTLITNSYNMSYTIFISLLITGMWRENWRLLNHKK